MAKDTIDFSGVPQDIRSGGRAYIPPGDYLVKIVKHEKKWKDNDKSNAAYYSWQFQVVDPATNKGGTVYTNTSLAPDALFNLRNLIYATTGKNVAGKSLNFDPSKLYSKKLGITVEDREYNDKMYSNVVDMYSEADYDGRDGDDEEEADEGVEEVEDDETLEEVDIDDL